MAKKIYEVEGTYTINIRKRVKANDEYEAMEIAADLFEDLHTEWNGNSVFVRGEAEEVSAEGYVEWKDAYLTDSTDYDRGSDEYEDWEDEDEED